MGEFRCPSCSGVETKVVDSRHVDAFRTRRRRHCKCGNKFSTYEIPVEEFRMMEVDGGTIANLGRAARKIVRDIEALTRQRQIKKGLSK